MIRDTHHLPQSMNVCLTTTSVLHQIEWVSLRFLNQNLRGISWIDGSIHENPESLNLVCGIPSRILGLNDCDELQTPEGWALVTDAKESMDSIPTWLRTDRWLAMPWQGALNIFTERTGLYPLTTVMPNIQLAMERSKKDWMKTLGKQRDGRDKASPYTYLKFSPMNYISISIFTLCFIYFLFIKTP